MDKRSLAKWFLDGIETYPKVYVQKDTPWQQSGFSGPEERWVACRKPIADCMGSDGTFLDIGCANGYLIECVLKWTAERGVHITPFGLDIFDGIAEMARARLPEHAGRIFTANAFDWHPAQRFDYVRTELVYVPEELQTGFVRRLQKEFLRPAGRLLPCEYRGRSQVCSGPWIDEHISNLGFNVAEVKSGFWEGKELIRIAVVRPES